MIKNLKPIVNVNGFLDHCYFLVYNKKQDEKHHKYT